MKNNITNTFLSIILMLFVGCKNNEIDPLNIQGKWELESSFGGSGEKKYAPGNGTTIKFDKNIYQNYLNDTLVKSGNYQVVRATNNMTNKKGDKIIFKDFSNTDLVESFVDIKEGKLTFSKDEFDAGSITYIRISK